MAVRMSVYDVAKEVEYKQKRMRNGIAFEMCSEIERKGKEREVTPFGAATTLEVGDRENVGVDYKTRIFRYCKYYKFFSYTVE